MMFRCFARIQKTSVLQRRGLYILSSFSCRGQRGQQEGLEEGLKLLVQKRNNPKDITIDLMPNYYEND